MMKLTVFLNLGADKRLCMIFKLLCSLFSSLISIVNLLFLVFILLTDITIFLKITTVCMCIMFHISASCTKLFPCSRMATKY